MTTTGHDTRLSDGGFSPIKEEEVPSGQGVALDEHLFGLECNRTSGSRCTLSLLSLPEVQHCGQLAELHQYGPTGREYRQRE